MPYKESRLNYLKEHQLGYVTPSLGSVSIIRVASTSERNAAARLVYDACNRSRRTTTGVFIEPSAELTQAAKDARISRVQLKADFAADPNEAVNHALFMRPSIAVLEPFLRGALPDLAARMANTGTGIVAFLEAADEPAEIAVLYPRLARENILQWPFIR